jgi:dynein heavy chain 1, cytosolic
VSNVRMPDGIRRDQFLAWVEQLEDRTTPDWLGLPNNAERVLLANRGEHLPYFDFINRL